MSDSDPAIFWSYAHFDNEHDGEALSWLCKRLTGELRIQTGQPIDSFFDVDSIHLAADWREAISKAVSRAGLLVAVMTPSYFQSSYCELEFSLMRERELEAEGSTLILPIYYVEAEEIEDAEIREQNQWAAELARRQRFDWRDLRLKSRSTLPVRRAIQHLASSVKVLLATAHTNLELNDSDSRESDSSQAEETASSYADTIEKAFVTQTGTQREIVKCLYCMHRLEIALDDLFAYFRLKVDPEAKKIETSAEFYYRLKDLAYCGLLDTRPIGIKTTVVRVLPEVGNVLFDRNHIKT